VREPQNPKSKISYMSQSSTRNKFSDILLDPTTIGIVGSIAVHAVLGANLALFTPSAKEIKKPEPGTVKVVELTPDELQRIPQAPQAATVPNPSQIVPPIYQPSTPVPPVFDPAPPQIVTAAPPLFAPAQTVPLPPKFGTKPPKALPKAPVVITSAKQKVITKPPAGKKDQKAIAIAEPPPPEIRPDNFKPTPEATPTPTKPEVVKKPAPSPTQSPKRATSSKPSPITPRPYDGEYDGDIQRGAEPSTPIIVGQNPTGKPTVTPPQASPAPSPQPTPEGSSDGNSGSYAGKYAPDVSTKLQEYITKYPGIKIYRAPPKPILKPYPPGVACSKSKQSPFIVLIIPFSKVVEGNDSDVLGTTGSEPLDVSTFGNDNEELSILAKKFGIEAIKEAEKNRPPADKDKQVLYQTRVQFDPTSCKK
jgi:hypothetical protein